MMSQLALWAAALAVTILMLYLIAIRLQHSLDRLERKVDEMRDRIYHHLGVPPTWAERMSRMEIEQLERDRHADARLDRARARTVHR